MESSRAPAVLDISRFVQAEASLALLENEEFIPVRPRPPEATSPAAILARALETEVAIPLLGARTEDDFVNRLVDCIGKFTETRSAYRVLARQGAVRFVTADEAIERIRRRAERVGGEQMADEFEFAASTFHRAINLAKGIERGSLRGEQRQRDLELIQAFSVCYDVFQCSQYVLYAASERDRTDDIQPAVSLALEWLRGSALNAYGAARERVALRKPPEEILEPLPFDEEDAWLAGIAS
jgi:hypothetical protein